MIAAENRDYKKGIELAKEGRKWAAQAGAHKVRLMGQLYLNAQQYWAYEREYDSVMLYSDLAVRSLKEALGPYHKSISISLFEKGGAYAQKGERRKEIEVKREAIANNIAYQGEFNKLAAIQEHQLANTFDQKVQTTRQEQAAKGRALNELLDQERDVFLTAAAPVLERLMREANAAVILERRSVFVSASAIEITDDAIALLDETLGSGAD